MMPVPWPSNKVKLLYFHAHIQFCMCFNISLFFSFFCPFSVCLQLTFLDMIMYIIFKEAEIPVHIVRWTRVFRPLFLINISEGRQVRSNWLLVT